MRQKLKIVKPPGEHAWLLMPLSRDAKNLRKQSQLLSQTQSFDNLAVPIGISTVQIIQQTPAPVNHHDQSAARGVVFRVRLEMRGQIVDSFTEQCDLYFG
jgi:hypothetical protein